MTPTEQLFKSLRNTQPKFDYHSQMFGTEFFQKNMQIFKDAIERCELNGIGMGEMIEVANRLLPTLPHKPFSNYPARKDEDSPNFDWAQSLGHLGSKREKKG